VICVAHEFQLEIEETVMPGGSLSARVVFAKELARPS
jgi:hypothetical protein